MNQQDASRPGLVFARQYRSWAFKEPRIWMGRLGLKRRDHEEIVCLEKEGLNKKMGNKIRQRCSRKSSTTQWIKPGLDLQERGNVILLMPVPTLSRRKPSRDKFTNGRRGG